MLALGASAVAVGVGAVVLWVSASLLADLTLSVRLVHYPGVADLLHVGGEGGQVGVCVEQTMSSGAVHRQTVHSAVFQIVGHLAVRLGVTCGLEGVEELLELLDVGIELRFGWVMVECLEVVLDGVDVAGRDLLGGEPQHPPQLEGVLVGQGLEVLVLKVVPQGAEYVWLDSGEKSRP